MRWGRSVTERCHALLLLAPRLVVVNRLCSVLWTARMLLCIEGLGRRTVLRRGELATNCLLSAILAGSTACMSERSRTEEMYSSEQMCVTCLL